MNKSGSLAGSKKTDFDFNTDPQARAPDLGLTCASRQRRLISAVADGREKKSMIEMQSDWLRPVRDAMKIARHFSAGDGGIEPGGVPLGTNELCQPSLAGRAAYAGTNHIGGARCLGW